MIGAATGKRMRRVPGILVLVGGALVLGLVSGSVARAEGEETAGGGDRLRKLKEKILDRQRERDKEAVPADPVAPATVSGTAGPAPTPGAGAVQAGTSGAGGGPAPAPAPAPGSTVKSAPALPAEPDLDDVSDLDLAALAKAGFEIVDTEDPVKLTYAVAKPRRAEYVEEIQALIAVPGAARPVPHHRLYQIVCQPLPQETRGILRAEYTVVAARHSKLQSEGKMVLERVTDEEGLVIPVAFGPDGTEDATLGLPAQDRLLDWLRVNLPDHPVKVGRAWTASVPVDMGDRREVHQAVYLLRRLVRSGGKTLAVISGRFQHKAVEKRGAQLASLGQERIVFDVTDGALLFREFRLEGLFASRGPGGKMARYQARLKGLVYEAGLFSKTQASRLERMQDVLGLFGKG